MIDRTKSIGASDVHRLYDDPMGLYLEKVGITTGPEENEAMWLGTNFEPVMDKRYKKETGLEPYPIPRVVHPTEPWRSCSPDRGVDKPPKVLLQYKTTGIQKGWGEPGTAEVPFRVGCQCQWELSLLPEYEYAEVPVYFFAPRREFRIYRIERDEETINNLIEVAREFWHEHVLKQVPPPLDATPASKTLLEHLYPQDQGEMLESNSTIEEIVQKVMAWEGRRDATVAGLTLYQNQLKDIIGEAPGVQTSIGKVTWKRSKDREVVDWKAAFDYLINRTDFSQDIMTKEDYVNSLIKKFTQIRPGSRVFRTYWKGEEE